MREAIVFENVKYTYPDGQDALKGVSLKIGEGETVCLIGPNGAGKSTLLLALLGFLPFVGSISVFGMEVKKKNHAEIRKNIGLVFQDPDDQLFMPSVMEDVMFGPSNHYNQLVATKLAREALKAVDLQGFENRLAHHLSYGEKKRVAIAGVLAMKPRILALDEPTSNLDHYHRRALIKTLEEIDGTKLIATHDLDFVAQAANRVAILKDGAVLAEGDTYEMLYNDRLLASAFLEKPCDCRMNPKSKDTFSSKPI